MRRQAPDFWWRADRAPAARLLAPIGLVYGALAARRMARPGAAAPCPVVCIGNFSLGGAGIALMGFNVAAFPLPLMLYLQQVHGLDALKAGLMLVPQAVISAVLSPWVGRLVDRLHPGRLGAAGFVAMGGSIAVLIVLLVADAPLWAALIALSFQGLGHAFIWSPNARTTIGDLDYELAGAGSGVYNTVRQLGSVLGSSSIAALLPTLLGTVSPTTAFATAMALPAAAMAIAVVVALLTTNPNAPAAAGGRAD